MTMNLSGQVVQTRVSEDGIMALVLDLELYPRAVRSVNVGLNTNRIIS